MRSHSGWDSRRMHSTYQHWWERYRNVSLFLTDHFRTQTIAQLFLLMKINRGWAFFLLSRSHRQWSFSSGLSHPERWTQSHLARSWLSSLRCSDQSLPTQWWGNRFYLLDALQSLVPLDMIHLERLLRESIVSGQPRTHRPWRKILIVIEGVYRFVNENIEIRTHHVWYFSMEGSLCKLPELIELKKKYRAFLYLDEAHSIGAMGSRGRGVVDYWKCNVSDVDVLMGTFTKSFAAAGGYIAGTKVRGILLRSFLWHVWLIRNWLIIFVSHHMRRLTPHRWVRRWSNKSYPFWICSQMMPKRTKVSCRYETHHPFSDWMNLGRQRINQLAWNTRYFRQRLTKMGFIVYGHPHSPVVPALLYSPSKIA